MKTTRSILLIISIYCSAAAFPQQIQNSGFESWSDVFFFENPDQFTTTNYLSYFSNIQPNVTKTDDAQSGSWAIRLESISTSDGPLFGAALIGDPDFTSITGGTPFTVRPDSVQGFAKYNVQPTDTAYFIAIFKKFGAPIGFCVKTFTGSQNNFTHFKQAVQWLLPVISPDTMITGMTSSTLFNIPVPGSTITFDNISFIGVTATYPNHDFENWSDFESEEPDNWTSSNIISLENGNVSVTKTTDSYEGDYAVKIENAEIFDGDTLGFITNGTIGDDGPIGGMPVNDIPDVLSGYYKYIPEGPDTAIAGVSLYKFNPASGNSNMLDDTYIKLPPANDYTYFELQVDYYQLPEPDTVNIAFGSGNFDEENGYVGLGSALYVDALNLTFKPNLVSVDEDRDKIVQKVFPNPASERVFIEMKKLLNNEVNLEITDVNGAVLSHKAINVSDSAIPLDVSEYAPGIYFYKMKLSSGEVYTGKFLVE